MTDIDPRHLHTVNHDEQQAEQTDKCVICGVPRHSHGKKTQMTDIERIAALIEAIEKAPHGYRCTSDFSDLPNPEDCDCWKAEALGRRS